MNMTSLPHAPLTAAVCYPLLYFQLCSGCAATTLDYAAPESIMPEMDSVWTWFDGISGLNALTNPRHYCGFQPTGADP
jgi:hypothetical protein